MQDALHTMTGGDWGRVLSLPLAMLAAFLAMWLIGRISRDTPVRHAARHAVRHAAGRTDRQTDGQAGAIDVSRYRCPPHQHCIDMDRSSLLPLSGGALLAHCCMQGCDVTVTIGRGITELMVEEEIHA